MKFGIRDAWLIYSHKRGAYYAPFEHGYTDELLLAGLYSEDRAKELAKLHSHLEPRRLFEIIRDLETFWACDSRTANTAGALLGVFKVCKFTTSLEPFSVVDGGKVKGGE
jgi:hypothetical protein